MKPGDIAAAAGKGLAAGAVGTIAITASQLLAQKLAGQEASSAPAEAVEKLVGVEPKGEHEEQRLTTIVHMAYGTGWGVASSAASSPCSGSGTRPRQDSTS
ncbi:MAG TPA: hypothetical protein VID07_12115 [Actinomycetes bacterium]